MNYIYKNVSDQKLVIPNVGTVLPGETIESQVELNNSNLVPEFNKKFKKEQEPELPVTE